MAGTAAFGTVLAGAALAAPAASTIAPMACNANYQHSVVTQTRLSLSRTSGQFGARNVANVVVTSDSSLVPTGRVRIITTKRSWTVRLDANGYARHALNRHLQAGRSYDVHVRYLPGCSDFGRSHSPWWHYTVSKASTGVYHLTARNITRGQHPRVSVDLSSRTGLSPWGRVRVRLFHNGQLRAGKTVRLHRGHATVWFPRVRQRRDWQVKVAYLGNRNFSRSYGSTSFWVHRR